MPIVPCVIIMKRILSIIILFVILNQALGQVEREGHTAAKATGSSHNAHDIEDEHPNEENTVSKTGSGGNAKGASIKNVQDSLNIRYSFNTTNLDKGNAILVKIQCKCLDDRDKIEYLSIKGELPREIEFITAKPTAIYDKNSQKISWLLNDLYDNSKELTFTIRSYEGGDFQVPTTIKARMRLKDGSEISGDRDVDPILFTVYNQAPELVQVTRPRSILLPIFCDRSVCVSLRDLDNDNITCNLYNEFGIITPVNCALNKSNSIYGEFVWDLPFFWWGTYEYTIKSDDNEGDKFTKEGEFPNKIVFEVTYGLSNLVILLALFSVGPVILAYISYKSYVFNKNEKLKFILTKEMDHVIEPLYLIFKQNNNIAEYISSSRESKFKYEDYPSLKNKEAIIFEVFEKKESYVEPNLQKLFIEYKEFYSKQDFSNAFTKAKLMFDYVCARYKYLKKELFEK